MLQVSPGARARCSWTLTHYAQVFVFDTRRGAREGEELEKVLAFFPSGVTPEQQQARLAAPAARAAAAADAAGPAQAAVGLVEALVGMTRIFAGAAAPLQSMTTAQHRHTFLEVEPGVFFVLVRADAPRRRLAAQPAHVQVVEAEAAPPSDVRAGALRAVLKETHAVWSLLHGSVRALLAADGTAETARCAPAGSRAVLAHAEPAARAGVCCAPRLQIWARGWLLASTASWRGWATRCPRARACPRCRWTAKPSSTSSSWSTR